LETGISGIWRSPRLTTTIADAVGRSDAGAEEAPPKVLDRVLRRWRFAKAKPFVRPGDRVLDIGCDDGALFEYLGPRMGFGVGIDPALDQAVHRARYRLVPGRIPEALPTEETFDVVTMLAVLEHLPDDVVRQLAGRCPNLLTSRGRIVITVPSPSVDRMLHWLIALRLMRGTAVHEHHGFEPATVPETFSREGLRPLVHRRFELGFNNLFVLAKHPPA
jgi:2-polyprenyl-3-methyl-5-hydroxy-6-metoxy-1,4-benzoquinol methylase